MTIEQDVQDLRNRVAALERRLSGDRIDLRAGGTSLSIHSGGIDIETGSRLTITAGQSIQITAGTAGAPAPRPPGGRQGGGRLAHRWGGAGRGCARRGGRVRGR